MKGSSMDTFKKLNYLFDKKLKWKTFVVGIIIIGGSIAELLGVSIILPIISMATNPNAIYENEICIQIARIFGIDNSNQLLILLVIAVIMIYCIKNIYLTWMTHRMNCFSKGIMKYFSTRLLSSYMKQPYTYFLNKNTAEILRSINSDTINLYGVVANVMQIMSQGLTTMLLIVFSVMTNPIMSLIVAVLLGGCAALIIGVIQKKMRYMGREHQRLSAYLIQYAKQSFEGIKEVKMMNREQYFIRQYADVYEHSAEIERICNLLSYIPKYLIETVCITGIMLYLVFVVTTGAELVTLVPQLGVFAATAFKLLPCMNALYANFSNMIYHKASIDVIYNDIKEVEDIVEDFSNSTATSEFREFKKYISVEDITFSYSGQKKAVLKNINVRIHKGESVAFIGESGGGKTTLVDIILGLLTPQQGRILVDGKDIQVDSRGWHNRIGYIPQMIFLLDDTIRNNVAFGIDDQLIEDDKVWLALKEAKMQEFVESLEDGLNTMVGEAGTRLSGGQRQRIGIARALYSNPDILVFDEATSALDNETEKEVMEAIENLHGNKTMIMIAHRLSTIEKCDHIYRVGNQQIEQIR